MENLHDQFYRFLACFQCPNFFAISARKVGELRVYRVPLFVIFSVFLVASGCMGDQYCYFYGRVDSVEGNAIFEARITIAPVSNPSFSFKAFTDQRGNYNISLPFTPSPESPVKLSVYKKGFAEKSFIFKTDNKRVDFTLNRIPDPPDKR